MPWVDLPQYSKRKCHFCDKKHHFEKRRKSHRPSKRPYFVENQQLTLRRIISGFVPYHHAPKRPFPSTPKKRILGFRCIKEVVMKKLIAVAMCSLFAGCIEPQEIKVVVQRVQVMLLVTCSLPMKYLKQLTRVKTARLLSLSAQTILSILINLI